MGPATGAGSLSSPHLSDDPGPALVVRISGSAPDLGDLLRAVADDDQDAFATLFDQVAPRVLGLVLRIVRNRAVAEEVTQEVMLQVWRQADRFDPGRGSPLAWVLTLAHRRAVDRVRAEQSQSDRLHRYESQQTPAYDATAEEAVGRVEAGAVHRALAQVGEPHRTTLELAYFGGLTHREVAQRLDIPLGTAKTRIRDGLRKLRTSMGGGEQDE